MKKLLIGLGALPFLAGVALADEPTLLSNAQMDRVTAGTNIQETQSQSTLLNLQGLQTSSLSFNLPGLQSQSTSFNLEGLQSPLTSFNLQGLKSQSTFTP